MISSFVLLVAIWTCTKICKVPSFHYRNCLKFFLVLSMLAVMIQVSGKSSHFGSKKLILSKKTPNKQVESFIKLDFHLK